ncbi:MAG: hypothetical protein HYY44_02425 [Deltaproteobacteria bacterium]|nr:hypothetical protein [Deltaproteobacteria bacterium]MBI4374218.1 hypothetical protein [Deltaproteobacteria bacterium]
MSIRATTAGEDRFLRMFWRELGGLTPYIRPSEIPHYADVSVIHARNAANDVIRTGYSLLSTHLKSWAEFLPAFQTPMAIPDYRAQLEKLRGTTASLRRLMAPDARLTTWINNEIRDLESLIASGGRNAPTRLRSFAEGRAKLAFNVLGSYEALFANDLAPGGGSELRYLIAQYFENRPLRAAAGISQVALSVAAMVVAGGLLLYWTSSSQSISS